MNRMAVVLKAGDDSELGQIRAQALPRFQRLGFDLHLACPRSVIPAARAFADSSAAIGGVLDSERHGFFEDVLRSLASAGHEAVAFLPVTADLDWQGWRDVTASRPAFRVWPPRIRPPFMSAYEDRHACLGWTASRTALDAIRGQNVASPFDLFALVDALSLSPPHRRLGVVDAPGGHAAGGPHGHTRS